MPNLHLHSAPADAGKFMRDARIAYSPELFVPLPRFMPRRGHGRPPLHELLMVGAVRLFHLMVSASVGKASAASAAGMSVQSEFLLRFQNVILPHLDAAYNFSRFLCRDADGAQDIVQEAFLRAYRNFESYRGGDPRAWLFAIVRNCCHAWHQQNRRKARYEQQLHDDDNDDGGDHQIASEDDTPETALLRRSEQHGVRTVIESLPQAMREILVLRELEDLSYREIAEIIDVPIGTVMSRLARARREFGEAWDRYCAKGTGL